MRIIGALQSRLARALTSRLVSRFGRMLRSRVARALTSRLVSRFGRMLRSRVARALRSRLVRALSKIQDLFEIGRYSTKMSVKLNRMTNLAHRH